MSHYSDGSFYNPAYHDSETLELDRRPPFKPRHSNPYAQDLPPPWQAARASAVSTVTGPRANADPWEGGAGGGLRALGALPLGPRPSQHQEPPWQRQPDHSSVHGEGSFHDAAGPSRFPATFSANMTMRLRGMRRMSMFPNGDPSHLSITEGAIRNELEYEEQNLVKELMACSTKERIEGIRKLPMTYHEKKHIRNRVLASKSSKKSRHLSCLADCSERMSLSLRRGASGVAAARQALDLWQGTMKEVGGSFGSSVLSYFLFLKSLLLLNVFSFVINFSFITVPMLAYDHVPHVPPNVTFRGLELLTGAGYFRYTVLYYGAYRADSSTGLVHYNIQLAYFFTIAAYMVLCGAAVLYSMASSFKMNYVLSDPVGGGSWQLLCTWDFSVTNEKAVRQRKNNLRIQLKESMSERSQGTSLTPAEKMRHFGIHLGAWFISTSMAVGCGNAIYYLSQYEQQQATNTEDWSPAREAETLLVPFVVSLINLVVPLFYSLFNKFELYSSQRRQIYALIIRNVILKMSILGILCYFWVNEVAHKFLCWESMVGQALYRLVVFDFFFMMLGSFFGEFLSKVIGTRWIPGLGVPEFDVARNVLDLIYAQTLAWIGIYFSPLLPVLQIFKFLVLFYLKKVSLIQNCQPPRRVGRAAQMKTIFIALLFFPSFVGSLSLVAYTSWSLTPSRFCGPFKGLDSTFSVVVVWMNSLEKVPAAAWAVWVYANVVRSEIFYFLVTIIILFITFVFWQVTQGRKLLILLLRQQIVNEGKDKTFLLDKLQALQKSHPTQPKSKIKKQRRSGGSSTGVRSSSNAMVQTFLSVEQGSRGTYLREPPSPSHLSISFQRTPLPSERQSPSDALGLTLRAGQRAEVHQPWTPPASDPLVQPPWTPPSEDPLVRVMRARDAYEGPPVPLDGGTSSASGVMMQVMEARRRAEGGGGRGGPERIGPGSSSALIQAMLARQQAQNEYDDGY
ncbi:transmembrane channel-like protein 5 [Gadus morhua]|uniref:transmembrane channel-like protein 5 n=1 Tax=Gadus morhua TaxID=8049 RepID=UPI0011B6A309|nr:transmembrane channel-like protein 5 [Gadus morhua]XP_030208138.1 transmembrane channel-like protein 5 [Gadus morhua]XP_030208139.1 transmembrane channel-like protein 5 [Gadus morhua]